ncbi:MAG: DUF748 domain-containing protein [Pseudomonadota bacterium]
MSQSRFSRWQWAGIIFCGLFVLYVLLGFFVAPGQLKKQLIAQAGSQAGVDLSIERVRVNPLALSVTLENLAAVDAQRRDLLSAREIHVNAQLWPLIGRQIRLKHLRLLGPDVNLILTAEGDPHWLDSVPPAPAGGEEQAPSGEPWVFSVDRSEIQDGSFRYREASHPEEYATVIGGLNFTLEGLTTAAGEPAPISLRFAHEGQGEVALAGSFALNPLKFDGQLRVNELELKPSWRYARYLHGVQWRQGTLNGSLDIALAGADGLDLTTANGSFVLADTQLDLAGGSPLLRLARLEVSGPVVALAERSVLIPAISLQDGELSLSRDAQGRLVLPAQLSAEAAIADDESAAEPASPAAPEEGAAPWTVTVASFKVEQLPIRWRDASVAPPVDQVLDLQSISVQDFSLAEGQSMAVELQAAVEAGDIRWAGTHQLTPVTAQGRLAVTEFPLPWLTGYVREGALVDLAAGTLGLDLTVAVGEELAVSGDLAVNSLATESQGNPLFSMDNLAVSDLSLKVPPEAPPALTVAELSVTGPQAVVALAADGASNLSALTPPAVVATPEATEAAAAPETPAEPAAGPTFAVDTFRIESGALEFSDDSVAPAYRAAIQELNGTVTGLNSAIDQPATVDFAGRLEGYADIKITGALNPADRYTQVTLSSRNVDLTSANTYAGKYVGRLIERGRLDLDLSYELTGESLKGSNDVTLGQFSLGSSVESPDAVSLPLDLAVALLKDPSGNIDLGIPVAGDLNDPQFRVGSVVFKAFMNLIIKAAASPFFILGKLIPGGGEDLQYVNFDPGAAGLGDSMSGNLEQLAAALAQRPNLRMDVPGVASRALDTPLLRAAALEQSLSLSELSPEERGLAISNAHETSIGPVPTLPPAEEGGAATADLAAAEQALLAAIEISDEALLELAGRRAAAIKTALSEVDETLTERIYVLAPRIVDLSGGEEVTVELVLAPL